jgi:hypothetical protein
MAQIRQIFFCVNGYHPLFRGKVVTPAAMSSKINTLLKATSHFLTATSPFSTFVAFSTFAPSFTFAVSSVFDFSTFFPFTLVPSLLLMVGLVISCFQQEGLEGLS